MSSTDLLQAPLAATLDAVPDPARQCRARWATRAQFWALGLFSGVWGVHILSVKTTYGLSEMALSLVLLAAAAGAVASLLVAGRLVGAFGPRRTAMAGAIIMGLMLALTLHWGHLALLLVAMLVFGAAGSLYDVAINTEGSALEAMSGRPIMGNLHGSFSLGGMAGAALAGLLLRAGWSATLQLAVVGAVVVAWVLWSARGMLPAHAQPAPDTPDAAADATFAWPTGRLLLIGLLIFAGMSAEGAMYDWSVLYLKQEVGMTQAHAAWGYAAFSGAMAAARFGGDGLRARLSEARLLRAGALLSALSMAVVLLLRHEWVSLAGFALVGAGLALVVPILYNAATRVPGTTRAAAIAAVSSIGYCGFMLGPPLIGALAHGLSLSWALGVVVLGAGVLAWGSRYVPEAPAPQAAVLR